MVTVITKTIGPTGRDYATFALAEADTSNIGTSANLVANDEAIVFEADDTTFTTATQVYLSNAALTLDATHNVSYTAASGRPVYNYTGSGSFAFGIYDPYTRWSGIDVVATSAGRAMQVRANTGYGADQAGTIIENVTLTANVAVDCQKHDTGLALGTSAEPITLRNVVSKARVAVSQFISGTGHTKGAHCLVVNCTHLGADSPNQAWNWALTGGMPDASFKIINCANLAQDTSNDANITGGGVDVSGSTNNIGNAAAPTSGFRFENIGGGIGAQYTPTTSFSTPLGAGDYSVFMGSNGSLADVTGNDVWNQGVGPSANASVPTTDINGVARSGATCNPGAFEADGFVAPTITTQTIGPIGRDYATFTLAEASLPAEDITFTNRAFVFEADAGTYVEILNVDSMLVSDATRNATYRCADRSNRPVIGNGTQSTTVRMRDDFTRFDGIDSFDTSGGAFKLFDSQVGIIVENCEATSDGAGVYLNKSGANIGSAAAPCVVRNVVTKARFGITASGVDLFVDVVNCTFLPGTTSPAGQTNYQFFATGSSACKLVNCIVLDSRADRQLAATATVTGSNNIGVLGGVSGQLFSTNGVGSEKTPSTAYDPGAGDFALYVGKNGALLDSPNNDVIDGGVGPASNSDVPTTDILGDTRSGTTTNPGAFALAQATAVLTRTIGPVGRDYATFTAAEADVTNIGGSADLVFENERIEFLADAATYSESVIFNSSLTTDPTRNVTYRPASGSEHGGVRGAGVKVSATGASQIRDDYMVWRGLELTSTTTGMILKGSGVRMREALITGVQTLVCDAGSVVIENSVLHPSNYAFSCVASAGSPVSLTATNCTAISNGATVVAIRPQQTSGTLSVNFTNVLILGYAGTYFQSGTVAVTGSNNFGGSTNPFPAALQGSPYPITPSTDPLASGADLAIYDEATGQLYDLPENAVWQAGAGTSTPGVPKFDILGVVRATGTANPGAFEAAVAVAAAATSSFDNNSALHAQLLETQAPWIWLYELQTRDDPPQRYRLTSFTKSVQFGLNGSGQPLVYSPAPITHGNVEEGTDGSLPTISVTLGNAGPIIGAALDAADGFVGLPVRIMLVSSLDIASGKPAVSQEGEVVSAAIKTEAVVLQISAFNLYQLQFPPFIHSRRRCRWIFGSAECGYNTQIASAGFSICNKTQANCEERGDDEVAQGFERQHPARFGAFPGIPRAGR